MCDVIVHIVSTEEKIEYGSSVVTNCGEEFLRTHVSAWPKRGLCETCLKWFKERKTARAYTVTEAKHPAVSVAPKP